MSRNEYEQSVSDLRGNMREALGAKKRYVVQMDEGNEAGEAGEAGQVEDQQGNDSSSDSSSFAGEVDE